jgi:hypothetical protein
MTVAGPEIAAQIARFSARLSELEEMECGPTQVAGMHALRGEMIGAANACRLDALWARHIAWANAQRLLATDEIAYGVGQLPGVGNREAQFLAAQEIAAATHVATPTAIAQVHRTATIAECMPAVWTAMDRGLLSLEHVKVLENVTEAASPRVTTAVTDQVVPLAIERGWTPTELRKAARRALIDIDPEGAQERAKAAKRDANVEFYPQPDDIAAIWAIGDAAVTRRLFDTLNDRAEAMARTGDERPVGARRFDALADAVLNRAASSGGKRPPVAQTFLTLPLDTYLGLNDHPGELAGYGPITAETARRLADDAALWRLVTDPLTGRGIDLGRRSYRPSKPLRRFVEVRDQECVMVGCVRPAMQCELDHRGEWNCGHPTDGDNLHPLCKLHHELKTRKRWRVDVNPDGSETWTSALGFVYTKRPAAFPVEVLAPPDDEVPEDFANVIPINPHAPPPGQCAEDFTYEGIPLPTEPPPLTDEEVDELDTALDTLQLMGLSFREYANRIWDEARAVGLVG